MKKLILTMTIIGFVSFASFSQDDLKETTVKRQHNIGMYAGQYNIGLSYRWFPEKFGIQLTVLPFFSDNESLFTVGGKALITIQDSKYTRLYSYIGYIHGYNAYETTDYDYNTDQQFDTEVVSNNHFASLGIGFEINAADRLGFNFHLGYGYFYHTKEDWRTQPDGGIGIFFKF